MAQTRTDSTWIRRFHPSDSAPARLVVFPHAGGSASFYFPMSEKLSGSVDTLIMQYPGRQDRRLEPCIEDIGTLADEAFGALRPWLDEPVAFFGHSMGAVVAFEVARRMRRELDAGPTRLFASGRRAPSTSRDESVHRGDDAGVIAEMRLMAGTDARLLGDDEILRMVMPAIRGDYTAIETYRCAPDAVVDCPIDVLLGDDDPKTSLDEAEAWQRHTTGGYSLHVFGGGHFYLAHHQPEIVTFVIDRIAG
jgi:surfactin synthase thioesterase subunit